MQCKCGQMGGDRVKNLISRHRYTGTSVDRSTHKHSHATYGISHYCTVILFTISAVCCAQYAIFLTNEFDISAMSPISVTLNLLFDLFDWTEKCYILFQTLNEILCSIYCDFSQFGLFFSELRYINSQLRVIKSELRVIKSQLWDKNLQFWLFFFSQFWLFFLRIVRYKLAIAS